MERLSQYFERLKRIRIQDLENKGKYYEFTQVYPLLERMYENYTVLENEPNFFKPLPEKNKETIKNNLAAFVEIAEEIKSLDSSTDKVLEKRDELINRTKDSYQNSYNFIRDFKIHLLENVVKSIDSKKFTEESEKIFKEISYIKLEAEETLKAIKQISGEAGVSKFSGIFQEQAEENKKVGNIWFWASVGAISVFLLFLTIFFFQFSKEIMNGVDFEITMQLLFSKLILLSFASVVLYQIIKNYNANMHLYNLNKHRENSLNTFDAFLNAANDENTKDAVLIQAARAVFEPGDTGYISKKDSSISPEFITNILGKKQE